MQQTDDSQEQVWDRAQSATDNVVLPSALQDESAAGSLADPLQSLECAEVQGELAAAAFQLIMQGKRV